MEGGKGKMEGECEVGWDINGRRNWGSVNWGGGGIMATEGLCKQLL